VCTAVELHNGASHVEQRHHPTDALPTDGASAVGERLVAAVAAAHVSAVQQDTVTWLAEANHTGIIYVLLRPDLRSLRARCRRPGSRSFTLQSLKGPPLLLPLPANLQFAVVAPADPEEYRCPRQSGGNGQRLPPQSGALLLSQQGVKVRNAQKVLRAI